MTPRPVESFRCDALRVEIYGSPAELGGAAADFVEARLRAAIAERGSAQLVLATGTSQFAFPEALARRDVDWGRIVVFHLDEYRGLPETHPASFRRYLRERILDAVRPREVRFLRGDAPDLAAEMADYERRLRERPIDVACIGIGENGHIAFNDPPVAGFEDPVWVKTVELDERCRLQQVNEGWFASLDDVPREAVTLTIPAIMASRTISCVVPEARKADAVRAALHGPISTTCPASVLRRHPDATLFLDPDSAGLRAGAPPT